MLVPNLYEDPNILHQNTVPVHSYFIPTSRSAGIYRTMQLRKESDRIQMLTGKGWKFRYYSDVHDLKDEFYLPDYKTDTSWTEESVPFCWQMRGFDKNQYTNIRYPFPFDPPYVPQKNPCGAYIRRFMWEPDADAPCTFLHFEGVDSCFYVWLNGIYIGYSQVTHHTSEFDVTRFLRSGENVLCVLVLKWCDGSYLEDQDKFRMSGIIRDVYLMRRPQNHITDYCITTGLSEDFRSASLTIRFTFSGTPIPVQLGLYRETDADKEKNGASERGFMHCASMNRQSEAHFDIIDPLLWNAETPNLYTLIIETENERITERVGFRQICVNEGRVLLNGSPIRFRGVNRHESDPLYGSVVDEAGVLNDLKMIKEYNFNAVRTSHYPNVPYFYQMCDELGLYVIDEADNESHGTAPLYFTEDDYAARMRLAHERIADNPAFTSATLDRVSSMVLRNRNRPCILVWSMGNECGYGCTFENALRWTKETDPTRLTHYESAYYLPDDRTYDVSNIDLFGRMYPAFDEIRDYFKDGPVKPLLLVEYCHSMGNSPGDFREYRDLTEQYPGLCGGFVWEWCDHAIFKGLTTDGKAMYWYGGDHGELQHDGNFCLDGLVYPDRTPHTGLYEYKNVYRPLRGSFDAERGIFTIRNYWDFLNAGDIVDADWRVIIDDREFENGIFSLPDLPPHAHASVPLQPSIPEKGRCYLTVTYILRKALAGIPAGHVLGFDEFRLQNSDGRNQTALAYICPETDSSKAAPVITESGTDLIIRGSTFFYVLNTLTGNFTSLRTAGREILKKPVDFNLWRAPTDNDRPYESLWKWERLNHTITRAYETTSKTEGDFAVISVLQSVAAMSVQPILRLRTEYRIYPDGRIRMDVHAEKDREITTLPRIGIRLFLDSSLDKAEYFGLGPSESYIDKCRSSRHGCFRKAVKDLHEDYIRPQENGSHFDCDYVRLTGKDFILTAASADDQTFSFNASCYTQEELESKAHNYELKPCGCTVLCIDHKIAGIGSKSCGPDLSPEYRVDDSEYNFAFYIRPETADH